MLQLLRMRLTGDIRGACIVKSKTIPFSEMEGYKSAKIPVKLHDAVNGRKSVAKE
jgi:hypothetical protein